MTHMRHAKGFRLRLDSFEGDQVFSLEMVEPRLLSFGQFTLPFACTRPSLGTNDELLAMHLWSASFVCCRSWWQAGRSFLDNNWRCETELSGPGLFQGRGR